MNIQPTYVTFEQAKLLKKKGFDVNAELGNYRHSENNNWVYKVSSEFTGWKGRIKEAYFESEVALLVPEQWQVVEWALQVHKIFISVMPYDATTPEKEWTITIFDMEWGEDKEIHFNKKIGGCKTKEEAYEKGISHFLTII